MTIIELPESPFRLTRLERCAVLLEVTQDAVITEAHAVSILQRGFALTGKRQFVLLFELGAVLSISPDGRRILAAARNILACGMVGAGPMDYMLSAPYERAVFPTEYFTERSQALEWLSLMHDLLCADPVEHTMSLTVDLDPFTRH